MGEINDINEICPEREPVCFNQLSINYQPIGATRLALRERWQWGMPESSCVITEGQSRVRFHESARLHHPGKCPSLCPGRSS